MGLLDVLNGMQNGPHGRPAPGTGGGGGMSPMTMAIIGLLAYKAIKSLNQANVSPAGGAVQPGGNVAPPSAGTGGGLVGGLGGGLGDLLKGGLGGLLGGAAAGGVLSGGLNDLLKQLQQNGKGDIANSWVGSGPNKAISPNDLASALGSDQINTLMSHTGLSREALLDGLSQQLPGVVDHLTPDGRVPSEQEAARML